MNEKHTKSHYKPLLTEDFVECPLHRLELVELDDPAVHVFSDFTHHRPAVISPDATIDAASKKMKSSGEHLLLVVDDIDRDQHSGKKSGAVVGQITACDIMGDAPVRLASENGIHHDDVLVRMAMTPRGDIRVLDWEVARVVKVGHLLATMHDQDCCHILVVEDGQLRGVFSQTEINKHLDHVEVEPITCAHTLADLVHRIG